MKTKNKNKPGNNKMSPVYLIFDFYLIVLFLELTIIMIIIKKWNQEAVY